MEYDIDDSYLFAKPLSKHITSKFSKYQDSINKKVKLILKKYYKHYEINNILKQVKVIHPIILNKKQLLNYLKKRKKRID